MPAFWWDNDPVENLFMEVTRRDDIGSNLRAPISARGGADTPGYLLVSAVTEGSIVVHYDSSTEQIVAVSRATGERHNEPIWWAARGSYARQANVEPSWLPGLSVGLGTYRPLPKPLPMAEIRQRSEQILQVREGLRAKHPGKSLYFPWTPYQDSVRTFQTYLAKFPRDVLAVLPEVRSVVDSLDGESSGPIGRDDVEEMEREIASSAGRPRPKRHGRGQGFAVDTQIKVAVESHAMNAALRYYEELGDVVDTSRKASFDYAVRIDGVTWHVEVKGTTGGAADVLLTRKEVEHAETYPHVALFVLSEIVVMRTTDGTVEVSGGHPILLHPWSLDGSRLTPLAYKYSLSA